MKHIFVSVAAQKLFLLDEGGVVLSFPVSTAKNGLGERAGSECTPRGWHKVAELIGADEPINTIFKARVPIGILEGETTEDLILTRIIRLVGCESAFNLGDGCDSYDRYIYIHGTSDNNLMGAPLSHGCIRMRNTDIITLFMQLSAGESVYLC